MNGLARYALVALIALLAALAAVWIGRNLASENDGHEGRLHAIMHERLELDARQEIEIDALEAGFARRRAALEEELRRANAELAEAVANEHEYGPAVERAVDRSHMAMGELQKATLSHVFAMRAVLRPDQARIFDEAVAEALTETGSE